MERRSVMDYFVRQGTDGDGLAAEMNTPERRRSYIAAFYSHRLWHGHYEFSREEIDFFTEPFADAQKFRASYGLYECNFGKRPLSDMVRFFEPVPTPTLILYGRRIPYSMNVSWGAVRLPILTTPGPLWCRSFPAVGEG